MEQWSILVELLAFFLVTIDLYGEKRIRDGHARLLLLLPTAKRFMRTRAGKFVAAAITVTLIWYFLLFMGAWNLARALDIPHYYFGPLWDLPSLPDWR
jgi:hypothetical protein